MTHALERRLGALEAQQGSIGGPVLFIRFVTVGGEAFDDPAFADIGGRKLLRADGETGDAFLMRVETEAKLAALPGCAAVALVWPRRVSDDGSST